MPELIRDRPRRGRQLVKVSFDVDEPEPGTREIMWGVRTSDDSVRIENVPLLAFGFSYRDVVEVSAVDSQLRSTGRVIVRGGHSTYRLMAERDVGDPVFGERRGQAAELGCRYERATARFLAVDVPPSADIQEVYAVLERGQRDGIWTFEEGHCGHVGVQ